MHLLARAAIVTTRHLWQVRQPRFARRLCAVASGLRDAWCLTIWQGAWVRAGPSLDFRGPVDASSEST